MIDLSKTKVREGEAFVSDSDYADPKIVALNKWAKENRPDKFIKGETRVAERAAALKEENGGLVSRYRIEDQDHHTDRKLRIANLMSNRVFMGKLNKILGPNRARLRDVDPGPQKQFKDMKALIVYMRGLERKQFEEGNPAGWKFITAVQSPTMSEWSLLGQDDHGAPNGIKLIGWRQVLAQLIIKGAITEQEAHAEFGEPVPGIQSKIYREKLYGARNRKGASWQNN
jgi:hypothetical protein